MARDTSATKPNALASVQVPPGVPHAGHVCAAAVRRGPAGPMRPLIRACQPPRTCRHVIDIVSCNATAKFNFGWWPSCTI